MNRRLTGSSDIATIALVCVVVGLAVAILMDHLQVRQEVLSLARKRSEVAYQARQAEDQARHLALEEQIRESAVHRRAAPSGFDAAKAGQRVMLTHGTVVARDAE